MRKIPRTLIFRKIKKNILQYTGIAFLIAVGLAFFLILSTIRRGYEQETYNYFDNYNYADYTLYGSFSNSDLTDISKFSDVEKIEGRYVTEYVENDRTIRLISITKHMNQLYFYEGDYPSDHEALIHKKYADATGLGIGDEIEVLNQKKIISGIVTSPEYVYLVKNEQSFMSTGDDFGLIFLNESFFSGQFNEVLIKGYLSEEDVQFLNSLLNISRTVQKEQHINYQLFLTDLKQIETFSLVFPLVFSILILLMLYVIIDRNIYKERRQIGIYKALGYKNSTIFNIYIYQVIVISICGSICGGLITYALTDFILTIFSSMFTVPGLSFKVYMDLWITSIVLITLFNVLVCTVTVVKVLKPLPIVLLKPQNIKISKSFLSNKIVSIFPNISFNSRYAVKSMLRNKLRFLTFVLGISGTITLLLFAFSFYDSIEYTQKSHFEQFSKYDAFIEFDPLAFNLIHPVTSEVNDFDKVLVFKTNFKSESYTVFVVDSDFKMLNIPISKMNDGIALPSFIAKEWGVNEGDTVWFEGVEVKVSAVFSQNLSLSIFVSKSYLNQLEISIPSVYNGLFVQMDDIFILKELSELHNFNYTTIAQEQITFESFMESLNGLVWFMIGAALILGTIVMLSMGQLNLTSRSHEYIFLRAIGYPLEKIRLISIKELSVQFVIAIPIGVIFSKVISDIVASQFSSMQFVLSVITLERSYFYTLSISALMAVFSLVHNMKYVGNLDIVESMKLKEDTF